MSPPSAPQQAHLQSSKNRDLEMAQPQSQQPMRMAQQDPQNQPTVGMRGGDRSGMCPGRFCFCVPCPLPCDFCII